MIGSIVDFQTVFHSWKSCLSINQLHKVFQFKIKFLKLEFSADYDGVFHFHFKF